MRLVVWRHDAKTPLRANRKSGECFSALTDFSLWLLGSSLLAACGGGGGDGTSAAKQTASPPLSASNPPPVTTPPAPVINPPPPTPAGTARYFAYVADFIRGTVSGYAVFTSGELSGIGSVVSGAGAVSVAPMPSGQFLYVANANSDTVSGFSINPATGALSAVPGSPFPTGMNSNPFSVAIDRAGQFA